MAAEPGVVPEIRVFAPGEYADAAAREIAARMRAVAEEGGRCRVALAGGGTPGPVYQTLARPPLVDEVPWERVELFWGDERCVPPDDPASNFRLVRETLLDPLPEAPAAVHRMEGERPPAEAARAYARVLADGPLDIVLLGMGDDGHTASLFPDTDPVSDDPVLATTSPVAPHARVSLSYGTINAARRVYLLVTGAGKAERLAEVHDQLERGDPELPAARVRPGGGRLVWLLDTDAASALPKEAVP